MQEELHEMCRCMQFFLHVRSFAFVAHDPVIAWRKREAPGQRVRPKAGAGCAPCGRHRLRLSGEVHCGDGIGVKVRPLVGNANCDEVKHDMNLPEAREN
ncbi:hypothetical protein [Paraburkholderia caribensis]|uniref:hypothetical protein n=1 Tax=Paraburkholderia caribensis TaxID=75105 RepID=UPI0012E8BB63|nr:hypothetical protein [Paraburkholderia caribensis]